ncbi:gliding motility-associated C-terminal domain-containing protein [bacterium SCSIO 12741]|nr:gliding motility-associated C-terminal domain-containing protein [bacterium SCSIO 12741]
MKKLILILAVSIGLYSHSQTNLVPNPGFELSTTGSSCEPALLPASDNYEAQKNRWSKVSSWDMCDRRGYCSITSPDRYCDANNAHSGAGYLYTAVTEKGQKEIVNCILTSNLISGNEYHYEYFVKTGGSTISAANKMIGFFLSDKKAQQTRISFPACGTARFKTLVEGQGNFIGDNITLNTTWQKIEGKFIANENSHWLIVGIFRDTDKADEYSILWDDFKIVDLGEPQGSCPPVRHVQNFHIDHSGLHQADSLLRSGYAVGAPFPTTPGNVQINPWNDVTFKAGKEVTMEPGFTTLWGTRYLAYIAPCSENPCVANSAASEKHFDFCGTQGTEVQISTDFQQSEKNTIKWSPSTGLSSTSVSTVNLTLPSTGSGVLIYTVEVTNSCGIMSQQEVIVKYNNTGAPATVNRSNTVVSEYEASFDLTFPSISEWAEINVYEKANSSLVWSTNRMYYEENYGNTLAMSIPLHPETSVCNDYWIEIKTKNSCNSHIAIDTLDWNRSSFCQPDKPQLLNFPTVFTPDGDGHNDEYCIEVCGAETYDFDVINRFGNTVFAVTGVKIDSKKPCLWDGGNMVAGTYNVILEIHGCGNSLAPQAQTITLIR